VLPEVRSLGAKTPLDLETARENAPRVLAAVAGVELGICGVFSEPWSVPYSAADNLN